MIRTPAPFERERSCKVGNAGGAGGVTRGGVC